MPYGHYARIIFKLSLCSPVSFDSTIQLKFYFWLVISKESFIRSYLESCLLDLFIASMNLNNAKFVYKQGFTLIQTWAFFSILSEYFTYFINKCVQTFIFDDKPFTFFLHLVDLMSDLQNQLAPSILALKIIQYEYSWTYNCFAN